MNHIRRCLLGLLSMIMLPSVSYGQECLQSNGACIIRVSAVIADGCMISHNAQLDFGVLNFGQYSTLDSGEKTSVLSNGSMVNLHCTPGMILTVNIDGGLHYQGQRRLALNQDYVAYQLYSDPSMQTEWGIGTTLSIPVTEEAIQLPVFGQLFLPSGMAPGDYQDTLTVTITY